MAGLSRRERRRAPLVGTRIAYRLLSPGLDGAMWGFETALARPAVAAFWRAASAVPSGRLLNLGTGTGRQLRGLSPRRRQGAVGLDFVEASLRRLRGHMPAVPVVLGAHRLPFDDGVFDAALGAWVWEVLAEPERAGQEVHRVLRPGGELVLMSCTSGRSVWSRAVARVVGLAFLGPLGAPIDERRLTQMPGFDVVEHHVFVDGLLTIVRLRALQEATRARPAA